MYASSSARASSLSISSYRRSSIGHEALEGGRPVVLALLGLHFHLISRSPEPWRMTFCARPSAASTNGTSSENLSAFARFAICRERQFAEPGLKSAIAPSRIDLRRVRRRAGPGPPCWIVPEAAARRARAERRVEGEEARRDLRERRPAVRAGVARRERLVRGPSATRQARRGPPDLASRSRASPRGAGASSSSRLTTSRSTTTSIVCFFCLSSSGGSSRSTIFPFTRARRKPCLTISPICFLVLALLAARRTGRGRGTAALRHREDAVHHLLDRLGRDLAPALRAVRLADRRVEEAEVVVDLRDRADGRARVLRRRLLLDRDRRRQALDRVDVRLLHLLEELAGVGREGLDVAPLPLREERVEGERGLPRAGHAGDDDEALRGMSKRDVLEVVLAGAADPDRVHGRRHSKHENAAAFPRSREARRSRPFALKIQEIRRQ